MSTISKYSPTEEAPILCIEFGGERIKHVFFPRQITSLNDIRQLSAESVSSHGQLEKIPYIFNNACASVLSEALKKPRSIISVSLRGPISEGRCVDNMRLNYPREITRACTEQAECQVLVENDAICFAKGCIEYLKLKSTNIDFPCLVLTLGWGVGGALIKDEQTVIGIEVSDIGCSFSELEKTRLAQELALQRHQEIEYGVHELVGTNFFNWIKGQTHEQTTFFHNVRIRAMCKDIYIYVNEKLGIEISSLIIGGGNGRNIADLEGYPCKTILLTPTQFQTDGISPDIVQLLGCHANTVKKFTPQVLIPSFEELEAKHVQSD